MENFGKIMLIFLIAIIIIATLFFTVTPIGRATWNDWFHSVQVADDNTNYKTLKKVEDTCRSMIASYNTDKLTYEQYKDSDNEEKQSWAEQAKMRANKTASTYNEYILKNEYVWRNNIPEDIFYRLEYVD